MLVFTITDYWRSACGTWSFWTGEVLTEADMAERGIGEAELAEQERRGRVRRGETAAPAPQAADGLVEAVLAIAATDAPPGTPSEDEPPAEG